MSTEQNAPQTARFFTGARRISIRFGKLPNGGRIPGGPYTLVQVAVGSVVLLAGWWTKPIWGPSVGTPLTQILALGVCAAAALWGSGKIPSTRRKIPDLLLDTLSAVTVPGTGRYKDQPVKLTPPRYYGGTVLMLAEPGELAVPAQATVQLSAIAVDTRTEPTPEIHAAAEIPELDELPANVIPLRPRTNYATGLDRLLDQARRKDNN